MKHILIVDNDPLFALTVSSVLTNQNYQVSIAPNGKEAAGQLAANHFDLIITDALMPYASGPELINKVRNNYHNRYTPVMVVSSVANEHNITSLFRVGADAYLKKPLDLPELLLQVRQLTVTERYVAA